LKSALRRSFSEAVSNGGWVVDWLWTLEEFGGSNFKLGSCQPGFSFATLPVTSIGPKKGDSCEKWKEETRLDIRTSSRTKIHGAKENAGEENCQVSKAY
jgi:hypothetical protein